MPITMQYGPISEALGLAQKAGEGQGFAEQRSAQAQAQQLAQQAQDEIDRQNSTMIQDTMQQQQNQVKNQQSAGEMAQQAAAQRANYQLQQQSEQNRSAQLQQQIGYQNGMLGVQQQNAGTRQQAAANTQDYHQNQAANQMSDVENNADKALLTSSTNMATSLQKQIESAQARATKAHALGDDDGEAAAKSDLSSLTNMLNGTTDPATGQPVAGVKSQIAITQARLQKRAQASQQQPQAQPQQWGNGSATIAAGGQPAQQIQGGQPQPQTAQPPAPAAPAAPIHPGANTPSFLTGQVYPPLVQAKAAGQLTDGEKSKLFAAAAAKLGFPPGVPLNPDQLRQATALAHSAAPDALNVRLNQQVAAGRDQLAASQPPPPPAPDTSGNGPSPYQEIAVP